MGVPSEVLFTIGILNIKPDDIVRDLAFVKLPIHIFHVLIGNIIPSALMICYRKVLRKRCVTGQIAIRTNDIFRCRAKKDENV